MHSVASDSDYWVTSKNVAQYGQQGGRSSQKTARRSVPFLTRDAQATHMRNAVRTMLPGVRLSVTRRWVSLPFAIDEEIFICLLCFVFSATGYFILVKWRYGIPDILRAYIPIWKLFIPYALSNLQCHLQASLCVCSYCVGLFYCMYVCVVLLIRPLAVRI